MEDDLGYSDLKLANPRDSKYFGGGDDDSDKAGEIEVFVTTNFSNAITMDLINFCLVCGEEVGNQSGSCGSGTGGGAVIKEEVIDLDGDDGGFAVVDANQPMLVVEGDEEEGNVWRCFHQLFNITKSRRRDYHGLQPFPFCKGCCSQPIMLFKLKKKVEELEKAIVQKVEKSGNKLGNDECNLQEDKQKLQCHKIRKGIVDEMEAEKTGKKVETKAKKGPKGRRGRPRKNDNPSTSRIEPTITSTPSSSTTTSRRLSNRSSKPVARLGVDDGASLKTNSEVPLVLLSKEDKYRAERYQDSFVKVEPEPLNVLDDDDDEDFSSFNPLYVPASPAHSWSNIEGSEQEEEEEDPSYEDESDSWIPSCRNDSRKTAPKKTRAGRKRKSTVSEEEDDVNVKKTDQAKEDPPIKKRGPGRPPKPREPELPGPKLKFKKSSMTKVDRKTGTITFLKVPLTRMEGGLTYKCTICSEVLPNEKRLMSQHVVREHTDRYACKICGKKLSSTPMLRSHLRAHTGAAPKVIGECPVCQKPYARINLLDIHKWSHYNEQERNEAISRGDKLPPEFEKKFQCDKCAKRFGTNHLLQKHHITNHQAEEERPKELCPMCGVAVHHLRGHIARVHEEVPEDQKFPCTQCDKKFTRYVLLMRHKRMVLCGVRDFKYTMCPREFATNKQLKEHTFVHMNIRKFQCEFCASAFVKKHHLQRHTRIYHDDGSAPRRPAFIRGPEKKTMEQRNCFKNQGDSGGGRSQSSSFKQEFS